MKPKPNDFLDTGDLFITEEMAKLAVKAMIEWAKERALNQMIVDTDIEHECQIYPKGNK